MKNNLSVNCDVDVNLTIPEETAKRCIKILNMYLKDTGRQPSIVFCNDGIGGEYGNYYRIDL